MRPVGAHTNPADPIAEAEARGCDVVQIFLGDPQSWKKPPERSDAATLAASDVAIYVHAPYLMNPASPNNRIRIPSRKTMAHAAAAAEAIGAAGLIVHGGHVGDEEPIEVGFERWRKALDSFETTVPILIENTAGGGNAVVREIANYAALWEEIGAFNVGTVLDTCHAWAGGNDLATAVATITSSTGRLDLIHCNDSKDPHDSRRDRHQNLGKGEIPEELLTAVVTSSDAPIIVETPGAAPEHKSDLAWLAERLST